MGQRNGRFMKQKSRAYKSYPDWRRREARMLLWALAVGGVAAVIAGVLVYVVSRNGGAN
jgi:hypothetical protein